MKRPVVIALLALCGLSCGCRDRFDVPDTPADAPAANITIASLHAFLHAETVVVREELTVGGTVVSSDEAGNFYRTLVLDDGTAEPNCVSPNTISTRSVRRLPPDRFAAGLCARRAERRITDRTAARCVQPLPDRLHLLARTARTAAASYGRTAGTPRYTVRNRTTRHGVVRPSGSYRRPAVPPRRGTGRPANVGGLPAFRRRRGADDRRLYECLRPFRRSGDSGGRVLADGCARIRHGRQLRQTIHPPNAR